MKADPNNQHEEYAGTLTTQIEETERRLWDRQLRAHIHTNALIKDLKQEMASPAILLLASELGFIVGELTKRPSKSEQAAAGREDAEVVARADVTPLKEALDFGSLLIALFRALPPTWIMETFHPEEEAQRPKTEPAAAVEQPKAGVDLSKSGRSPSALR
jgi:hypothetical protein